MLSASITSETLCACLLACLLAGCGGDDGGSVKDASGVDGLPRDAAIDAPPDAPTAVRRVACPPTADATITTTTTGQYAWVPDDLTMRVGEVVRIDPGSLHRASPHLVKPTDDGLTSGAPGEIRCLLFTQVGTYNFQCGVHPVTEGIVRVVATLAADT